MVALNSLIWTLTPYNIVIDFFIFTQYEDIGTKSAQKAVSKPMSRPMPTTLEGVCYIQLYIGCALIGVVISVGVAK